MKTSLYTFIKKWDVILILIAIKLIIHLIANTQYGLHRDAFLYLAEAKHLGWGYMEVPPMIAALGQIPILLGESLFVIRLVPTLIGVATLLFTLLMVKELGGNKRALWAAGLAFITSMLFLRMNMLFQPTSPNLLMWTLSSYYIIRLIKSDDSKYWYILGVVCGFGILTKYSIAFFYLAFGIGLLLTPHRKWLATRYPYLAALIALVIAAPNLHWQYIHNLPVITHITELAETQLVNMNTSVFLTEQLLFHVTGTIVWLIGLGFLLFRTDWKNYRILAWIFVGVIGLLLAFSGKSYYSAGVYPMLMAAGGVALEILFRNQKNWIFIGFITVLTLPNILFMSFGATILPISQMQAYCDFLIDHDFDGPMRWEDGKVHNLPQDYADMFGWEESVKKVADYYHSLPKNTQEKCLLFGGGYGHAGALTWYKEKYNLPTAYSFNSSFIIWNSSDLEFDNQIIIDDSRYTTTSSFHTVTLIDSVENVYARDPGYIYHYTHPKKDLKPVWKELVERTKTPYNFE